MRLGQTREELQRIAVLLLIGAIQADNDLLQIRDFCKVVDDTGQRLALQLGIERGQKQPQGTSPGKFDELTFELFHRPVGQVVQCCDDAVLIEIRHVYRSSGV